MLCVICVLVVVICYSVYIHTRVPLAAAFGLNAPAPAAAVLRLAFGIQTNRVTPSGIRLKPALMFCIFPFSAHCHSIAAR